MNSFLSVLNKFPASTAQKLLAKFDPRFKKYFASAVSYGIDANRALDYLQERFTPEAGQSYEAGLERKGGAEQLRPDQMVSRSQLRNEAIPAKLLKGAASIGIGAALGGPVGAGIEALGEAEEAGAGFKPRTGQEATVENLQRRQRRQPSELSRQSLSQQFQESRRDAPIPLQVFGSYSQEMGRALASQIQKGQDGIEAAIAVASDPRFAKQLKAMERDFKAPIDQIVMSLFGPGGQGWQQAQGGGKEDLLNSMRELSSMLQQMQGPR